MPTAATQISAIADASLAWQPEDELIQSAQGGDSSAFEALMREYSHGVEMQCARKGLRPDEIADVTQDVFIKVFRNLPNYRHDTAFKTWLFRVTENCIFDHFRRRGRYLAKHGPMPVDEEERPIEYASTEYTPEQTASASLLERHLKEALNKLSPDQRETFLLKEVQGLKYEEIAEREGCSVGTIKSRIFRARQVLMGELQEWM